MAINPVIDINTNLDALLTLLGSEGDYVVTKTSATTKVIGLISPMDRRDTDLIQSYGVNGARLTFKAAAFTTRPVKYDSWTWAGKKYIFDTVSEIIVKGVNVGYTVFVRGTVG